MLAGTSVTSPSDSTRTIEVPAGHATGELRVAGRVADHLGEGYTAQPVWRRAPWLRRSPGGQANRGHERLRWFDLARRPRRLRHHPGHRPERHPHGCTHGRRRTGEWLPTCAAGHHRGTGRHPVVSAASGITTRWPFWDGFSPPCRRAVTRPSIRRWGKRHARRINYPPRGSMGAVAGIGGGQGVHRPLPSGAAAPCASAIHGLLATLPPTDWWLFGHELGHQCRPTGHGITEVGVNLFRCTRTSMSTRSARPTAPLDHAALADRKWCRQLRASGPVPSLIDEFGWHAMKAVFPATTIRPIRVRRTAARSTASRSGTAPSSSVTWWRFSGDGSIRCPKPRQAPRSGSMSGCRRDGRVRGLPDYAVDSAPWRIHLRSSGGRFSPPAAARPQIPTNSLNPTSSDRVTGIIPLPPTACR